MRWKKTFASVALAASALLAPAGAQEPAQDDPQLIEDFVRTRGLDFVEAGRKRPAAKPAPKVGTAQNKARRRPGKASGAQTTAAAKKPATQGGAAAAANGNAVAETAAPGAAALKASAQTLGLGYTLYQLEDRAGGTYLVATDDSKEFKHKDRIRLALEASTDGYLYVFNTTNGTEPVMLYPHASIDGGDNRLAARRSEHIPAGDAGFEFDQVPGVERLYVVISRRPLAGVPVGDELVALFPRADESSHWAPSGAEWSQLEALFRQRGRARQGRLSQLTQLRPVPAGTLTRGLTVSKDAPPPAVVRVSDSPDAELLVTVISLVHK